MDILSLFVVSLSITSLNVPGPETVNFWDQKMLFYAFWYRAYDLVIGLNMFTMVCVVYEPLIVLPPSLYVDTSRKLFHPIWPTVEEKHQ